ncbi:MAG: NUDIX hydrolase [Coriobacteriia bacterium]|nr:NUDIX hydrolase [Coriobacteriia bacterium]
MPEMIDIYDKNHQPTGETAPRKGLFLKEGQYMLYALAIIQDPQGRILITQRAHTKHWGAGWWEVSGGGVLAGETSLQAITREVAEEVGLDVSDQEPELVYSYENVDLERGDNYLVDIYRYQLDVTADDVTLQEEEAVDARMATWEQITELKAQGIFLHYDRIRLALEACGQL